MLKTVILYHDNPVDTIELLTFLFVPLFETLLSTHGIKISILQSSGSMSTLLQCFKNNLLFRSRSNQRT